MIQSQIAFAGTPQGNIKTQEIATTADFGVSRQFWATRITGNDSIIKTIVIQPLSETQRIIDGSDEESLVD